MRGWKKPKATCCGQRSRSFEESVERHRNVHLHFSPGDLTHVFGVEDEEVGGLRPRARADDDAQHHPCGGHKQQACRRGHGLVTVRVTARTRHTGKSRYYCVTVSADAD